MSTTGGPGPCISCGQRTGAPWYVFPGGLKCTPCVYHEYLHKTVAKHEALHKRLQQKKGAQP